jgi:hypothetical protein
MGVFGHLGAEVTVRGTAATGKFERPVTPAACFHAAHGDGQLGLAGHQDAGVEDAILLGADQLLARHQKHAPVGFVDDLERGHAAALVDFRNIECFRRQGLVEGSVVERLAIGPVQPKHLERAGVLGRVYSHSLK